MESSISPASERLTMRTIDALVSLLRFACAAMAFPPVLSLRREYTTIAAAGQGRGGGAAQIY